MSCNIVINQLTSLPSKTKAKDQKRVEAARRGRESYMKKLRKRILKDNQEVQMTLKEFINNFRQGVNDPVSMLIIEETMHIMKEEHNTEINISIRRTDHEENLP